MEFIATPDASRHGRGNRQPASKEGAAGISSDDVTTPVTNTNSAILPGGGKQTIKDSFRALVFSPGASDPTYNGLAPLSMTPAINGYQYAFPDEPQTVPDGRGGSGPLGSHGLSNGHASTPDLLAVPTPYLRQAAEEAVAREVLAMAGTSNDGAPPTPAIHSSLPSFQTPFLGQMAGLTTPLMKPQPTTQIAQCVDSIPKLPATNRQSPTKPANSIGAAKTLTKNTQPSRAQVKHKSVQRLAPTGEQPIMMKPMHMPMQPFFFPYSMPPGQANPGMYHVMMAPTMGYLPPHGTQAVQQQIAVPQRTESTTKKEPEPQTKEAREAKEKEALVRELKKKTREAALVRFRQKKRERSAGKLIRYDCRKKLADARPRIKGRFVRSAADETREENQVVPLVSGP